MVLPAGINRKEFVAYTKSRLAPRDDFVRFWESEADFSDAIDRRLGHRKDSKAGKAHARRNVQVNAVTTTYLITKAVSAFICVAFRVHLRSRF